MSRRWDVQFCANWWLSLGFHFDHTAPTLTFHLPGVIVYFGRCKQPGQHNWTCKANQGIGPTPGENFAIYSMVFCSHCGRVSRHKGQCIACGWREPAGDVE